MKEPDWVGWLAPDRRSLLLLLLLTILRPVLKMLWWLVKLLVYGATGAFCCGRAGWLDCSVLPVREDGGRPTDSADDEYQEGLSSFTLSVLNMWVDWEGNLPAPPPFCLFDIFCEVRVVAHQWQWVLPHLVLQIHYGAAQELILVIQLI